MTFFDFIQTDIVTSLSSLTIKIILNFLFKENRFCLVFAASKNSQTLFDILKGDFQKILLIFKF